MSEELKRGQKINFTQDYPDISKLTIELSWELASESFAVAFLLNQLDIITSNQYFIYKDNLHDPVGSVLMQPVTNGSRKAFYKVLLNRIPDNISKITFAITGFNKFSNNTSFMVDLKIYDDKSGNLLFYYKSSEPVSNYVDVSFIFGEIYRHNNALKFNTICTNTNINPNELCRKFDVKSVYFTEPNQSNNNKFNTSNPIIEEKKRTIIIDRNKFQQKNTTSTQNNNQNKSIDNNKMQNQNSQNNNKGFDSNYQNKSNSSIFEQLKNTFNPPPQNSQSSQNGLKDPYDSFKNKNLRLVELRRILNEVLLKYGLTGFNSRVHIALDSSSSTDIFYENGSINNFIEAIYALTHRLDNDKKLETTIFTDDFIKMPPIVENNFETYLRDTINPKIKQRNARNPNNSADEYKAMADIFGRYKRENRFNKPLSVFFLSDGDFYDKSLIESLVNESSDYPIFWQFFVLEYVSLDTYKWLEYLPTNGRVKNVNVIKIDDLKTINLSDFYDKIFSKLFLWVQSAKNKNIF